MSACLNLTGTPRAWPPDLQRRWIEALSDASRGPLPVRSPPWRGHADFAAVLGDVLGLGSVYVTAGVRALIPAFALTGRTVVVERPGFAGIREIFEHCGARVVSAPLDAALESAAPAGEHLIWITSPGRNPDGWSLDEVEVGALEEFIGRGGMVVQNETYRFHCGGGLRVPGAYLVGSFAKLAGPWARTGWISDASIPPVHALLRSGAPSTPWQAAWARFASSGGLAELLRHARRIGRNTVHAARSLAGRSEGWLPEGASLLVDLPAADAVGHLLRTLGIRAGAGLDFDATEHQVRLSFLGCTSSCAHDLVLERIRTDLGGMLHVPTGRG